jgi:hypothetical protein
MGQDSLAIRFRLFCRGDKHVVDDKENRGLKAQKRDDFQAQSLGKHVIRSNPLGNLTAFGSVEIEMDQSEVLTPIKARARAAVIVRRLIGSVRRGLQSDNGASGT